MPDAGDLGTHRLDRADVVRVCADHHRLAVADHVAEISRAQAVIQRHEDRAELRHGVELLEHRMRIGRDDDHPVTGAHAEALQRRRPAIAALEELRIRQAQRAINDGFALRVQQPRAARELQRR